MKLKDQVAIVTGAGRGIGRAVALALAREGAAVVLAEEVRSHGIRVGALCPGAVDTSLWDSVPNAPERSRMLRPEDVAEAALLMASLPPGASLEDLTLLPLGGIL